ncbi:DUF4038 domain-containing protein [Neobacillus drentensis]|uniref:DUF5060 domain-containing protein n=1 Tax=Neobacillus drentensis TaxID=220684 RepID=UPI001F22D230|nr:DUF5060 domain-containing protein [Neobacillus drentensis]ULT54891.1 DUF4038 domain-containing protein [Neobacillus drentensis]
MIQIEKYNIFERSINGPKPTKSNVKVDFIGTFSKDNKMVEVKGFYNGNGEYVVRFMPDDLGVWHYELKLNAKELITESGEFECIKQTGENHGPAVTNGMKFQYADGAKFIPFGTTIYAWIHQPKALIEKTIETLSKSPFNKVRMCVFPKSLFYNNNEPELFPFEKDKEGKWDVHQPNFEFWNHLETQVKALLDLGIEADLILFHPYDRWGFSKLGLHDNLTYLDYCVRRLAAYRNIWWSLANEYDTVFSINEEDWEVFGKFISSEDVYNHLLSNHNLTKVYDASKPWITHCSIQTNSFHKSKMYRDQYQKPVMIDECRYEGNIEHSWGNITAFEMVHRFWAVMVLGGYCTHGETYHRDDEVLWWAKGGELHGESVERIAFLKKIMHELEGEIQPDKDLYNMNPNEPKEKNENEIAFEKFLLTLDPVEFDTFRFGSITNFSGRHEDKYIIKYLGRERPCIINLELPDNSEEYRVEVIDIWDMTRETVVEKATGKQLLDLPGKEGIAVLATKVS